MTSSGSGPSSASPSAELLAAELLETNERLRLEIAERAQVSAALEESELRYRTLVSQIRDYAIFGVDAAGRAVSWNEGVRNVLGYAQEEFIGTAIEVAFLPEDVAAGVPWRELEIARDEGVASNDRWLRRKDGTQFFAMGRTTRRTDANGNWVGFTKVLRDETQRVLAEIALRESETRFRTLVENLHDYAIFLLDAEGRITEWTEGAQRVKGFRAEEVLGRHVSMFYPPEALAAGDPQLELEQASQSGRVEREGWRLTRDGRRIWVNEIATAVYDRHDKLTGFTKISRDLTERKRGEDALREADRRKDEFLATLAHELRNPLAPLRNGLQIIRLSGGSQSALQGTVHMMNRQLTHLVRLVDDLLDVARIRSGKVELRKSIVSLAEVLATSAEASRAVIDAHRHQLSIDTPDEDLLVEGDFDRLAQVLSNLLSNAAKYMESGGQIRVTLTREGDGAVLKVADAGIGIPEADLPRVFELFSQVRAHQGRAEGGLGIGLSLAKSLIELHGGSISAHSAGPGQGSQFTVRLPLVVQVAASDGQYSDLGHTQDGNERRRKVLVVDDNIDAATSLATLLTMRGHDVIVAHNGLEAIEKTRSFTPEVVLMDLGMPHLDGIETARRLRSLPSGEQLRLIAITGWGQDEDRARTRAAGFDTHLVKPADPAEIVRALGESPAH
jgi:PAS domain S-box-containing protein